MKHIVVAFVENDKTYGFRHVSNFDQFRKSIWAFLPNGIDYWIEWNNHNTIEQKLEDQFGLDRGSFKGAFLIFGPEKIGRLLSDNCRRIYLDSRSEGYISINLDQREVISRVIFNDRHYVISYPLETVRLSIEGSIVAKYLEFIRGTDFEESEGNWLV
jgi:hypothetical protein